MPLVAEYDSILLPSRAIHLLQKLSKKRLQKIAEKSRSKAGPPEENNNNIICKLCKNPITSNSHAIAIDGQRQHTCSNPAGIAFTIRSFSAAPGCVNQGTPTLDFTWFDGYAWNHSLCSHCFSHLGWFFQSDSHSFFGLISDRLHEEKSTHT